jgi:acyl-CoA synthetase (AMP-forming)/AMP-acid ligase II
VDEPAPEDERLVTEVVIAAGGQNIAALIDRAAEEDPDRAAVVVIDEVITYRHLRDETMSIAAHLAEAGTKPGDHVAMALWGGLPAVAGTLACAHLGAAVAAMNPLLTPGEIAQLRAIASCIDVDLPPTAATHVGPVPPRAGGGARDALVLFTSGTTGLPKAVPISHDAVIERVGAYRAPFDRTRAPSVGLMCVPVFHVGGLLGLLLSLYAGDTTVIQPRFDAGQWLELAERHRVASVFLVPTMLQRILNHPACGSTDLSHLRSISYGAAAAPASLIDRAVAAFPDVAFANVFGQTETLGAYTTLSPADHRDPRRRGSVGLPLPGVEVRVVDLLTGAEVTEPGTAGELWVQGSQTTGEGWLHTGDLAYRDADGYLYPTGRLSDTINRGGEKFGPAEIADVLRRHPDVIDVAVAGVPDPEMGERVGVAVVGRRRLDTAALREWCRPHLAPYKLPEVVVNVEALPYNELGKLTRKATADLIVREGA